MNHLLSTYDLKVVCARCAIRKNEITYTLQSVVHQCTSNVLLARAKGSRQWRHISRRPEFPRPSKYDVCWHFVEGSGCTVHYNRCTFARSLEEAAVWNFEKEQGLDHISLCILLDRTNAGGLDRAALGQGQLESFARSTEEACLWNFGRNTNMDNSAILQRMNSRHSLTPEDTARNILKEFSGTFLELCQACFLSSPQRVTVQRGDGACSAAAPGAHAWRPVLVHHVSGRGKEVYHAVRPLPPGCTFEYCSHVIQGKPCWHEALRCSAAHSELEMAVWQAESGELAAPVRPLLLRLSQQQQQQQQQKQSDGRGGVFYCKACLLTLSSSERFLKHCASPEHAQIISGDSSTQWETRPPPHNHREDFGLCAKLNTCEYGDRCVKAHSEEELREWHMRTKEEEEISANIDAQGLMSYAESFRKEYTRCSNEADTISEYLEDVSITCEEDLSVENETTDFKFQWHFGVDTERRLQHVALLKNQPGASFSLSAITSESVCSYSLGKRFQNTDSQTYNITVFFTSAVPGLYEQWLVLDFDMRPVLLRILKVTVGAGSQAFTEEPIAGCGVSLQPLERWHPENKVIIPCVERTEDQDELLKKYKPPQTVFGRLPVCDSQTPWNADNYREKMHNFLYREEQAENELVSRIGIRGEMTTSESFPTKELFGTVLAPFNLTPDTPEGCVLKRSIQTGLIAPSFPKDHGSKVYEAIVLKDTANNKINLKLSKRCCSDLQLKTGETHQMELQFQLDRFSFCVMHKAIDRLPDTNMVLPDLDNCEVPLNSPRCHHLNVKQQAAVDFIIGKSDPKRGVAPLLIYGPFGTGKTFTLATAVREIAQDPQNKVLICTHTNSSADLYVKDHFHSFIINGDRNIKPIRIKTNRHSSLKNTDEITLKYCLLSEGRTHFLSPTKKELDSHKVVITTTTMAKRFHDLKLQEGYFTHILIDEASQMLECEALIPLGLAGPSTRVVLAGDHMQMGPKLFSVDDHQRSDYTLLNRLFHYYQRHSSEVAQKSRILFNENYRSTKEIVEFVSTHFYVGRGEVIKCGKTVPAGPNDNSIKFHHVQGDCQLNLHSMSWSNNAEVNKVVEVLEDILQGWPHTWGARDPSSICVLSEGWQVKIIRTALWRKKLEKVLVENFANVQGKEFRAVIITSVQTRESLKTAHLPGMELFNDARVLNTAMTRAQSLVVVVGDATALSYFGKSSRIWKCYIDHCIRKNSLEPKHFTKDFFEKDIEEMARFRRPEPPESFDDTDMILQQLKDEYDQCETDSDQDNLDDGPNDGVKYSHNETMGKTNHLQLCKSQPAIYKHGQLVMGSSNSGYIIQFDNPTQHIHLKGRKNLGHAFNGDEVVVRLSSDDTEQHRVVDIINGADSKRVFVCTIEDPEQYKEKSKFLRKIMVPIVRNSPKICTLILRKYWKWLTVWKHTDGGWKIDEYREIDEHLIQNHVFMVQVICWKDGLTFPLGRVIKILPIDQPRSLEVGLRILNEEFKVTTFDSHSSLDKVGRSTACKDRVNLCGIITFTVDPLNASALDDAISIRDEGEQYELGVHIADVASFVSPGSILDEEARQRVATYHRLQKEQRPMFPEDLIKELSLLFDEKPSQRDVISLIVKVNKETNEIVGKPTFQLSVIQTNVSLSYEATEDIICGRNQRIYQDVEVRSIRMAYHFAKAQRKIRLRDWAYAANDKNRQPGKRKAHLMIEELNVLFNFEASKILTSTDGTKDLTPLRCQAPPKPEQLEQFKKRHRELVPLSFHVRNKVGHNQNVAEAQYLADGKSFHVLTKVWNDIQAATREGSDIDKIVDLIAADDIHPQLIPVLKDFKECLGKAYVIRSKSSSKAEVGHYSLNLKSYTQASSPIRRYNDIVLQRLLHTLICGTPVDYSPREINMLCEEFQQRTKTVNDYEKKAEMINLAMNVKKHNVSKLAIIVRTDKESECFKVSFPFDKDVFPESLPIMYTDLQLDDQPVYDKGSKCMTLKWKKRVYTFANVKIRKDMKRLTNSGCCTEIPASTWKAIVEAVENESWTEMKTLILGAETKKLEDTWKRNPSKKSDLTASPCTSDEQHYIDLEVQLKPGDILQLQITSEVARGYLTPTVQLMSLNDNLEICIDHAHSPITAFSKLAISRTKGKYLNPAVYISVWEPLCDMESAETAVCEGDSIIIEDLVVNFHREHGSTQWKGSFNLPLIQIKEWAIGCDLDECLLCIRRSGLKPASKLDHSKDVDPSTFTWVAHGVTVKKGMNTKKTRRVDFNVNHLPMDFVPDCVFQKDTCFTVELIPKLLPDIRKTNAVRHIASASDLVQSIALGRSLPREAFQNTVQQFEVRRLEPPIGLPKLNETQYQAVEKALDKNFTVIQGPPGTGKTVVGVYIVFWFHNLNTRTNRRNTDHAEQGKKDVILYCGPSNKSVDVVAEYLLKFGDKLRPLRVYSQQVEMLDYPYPGSSLQLSHAALRQERSIPQLRSITLHHLMREDHNPFSAKIKEFDQRIKRALQKEAEELTDAEVDDYKDHLKKAREHEFKRHDIIICTCTASSSRGLTKAVSARQIVIDECAMATEPQALIPLVCNKPEKHEEICQFPSEAYYENRLITAVMPPKSVLLIDKKPKTIVFGHINGTEINLVVSTKKGNQNSQANVAEQEKVVEIAESLVKKAKVEQESIVILSPYNSQVWGIKNLLQRKKLSRILVSTISKSQGSEWRYVILSTVRSLPTEEIPKDAGREWRSKHVGFVGDPNQINVGITRAKEGLCIIGNQELLECSPAWMKLLKYYNAKNSVTTAERISVAAK
ncbi:helicase with zinc finger domain 2 isoform X2 [Gadus morhua]|uniref:helicase with zinc finger domain 2 isoform X2 n=1 Tax=Gadus morhua TaxID=8049 RepID=UPI0011B68412|nr:helicase with zinc finger domain 2 isoform X2 [Gadus morhua]